MAGCGRLCQCTPSATLAVLVHRVTKMVCRHDAWSRWNLYVAPQAMRPQGAVGAFSPIVGVLA